MSTATTQAPAARAPARQFVRPSDSGVATRVRCCAQAGGLRRDRAGSMLAKGAWATSARLGC